MTTSKLTRYPAVYSKILLTTPLDGTPLDIPVADETAAQRERLQFYNFLKFVRRNPRECAHLHANGRATNISISLQGRVLRFAIRGGKAATSLEAGFQQAVQQSGISEEAIALPVVADNSSSIADDLQIPGLDDEPAQNPLDLLNNFKGN